MNFIIKEIKRRASLSSKTKSRFKLNNLRRDDSPPYYKSNSRDGWFDHDSDDDADDRCSQFEHDIKTKNLFTFCIDAILVSC